MISIASEFVVEQAGRPISPSFSSGGPRSNNARVHESQQVAQRLMQLFALPKDYRSELRRSASERFVVMPGSTSSTPEWLCTTTVRFCRMNTSPDVLSMLTEP